MPGWRTPTFGDIPSLFTGGWLSKPGATESGPLHDLQLRREGAGWWRYTRVNLSDADMRICFIGGHPDARCAIAGDIHAAYVNTVPNHYYWFRGPGMRAYWYQEWH